MPPSREIERLIHLATQGDIEASYALIPFVRRGQVPKNTTARVIRTLAQTALEANRVHFLLSEARRVGRRREVLWGATSEPVWHIVNKSEKATLCRIRVVARTYSLEEAVKSGRWRLSRTLPDSAFYPWPSGTGKRPPEGGVEACPECLARLRDRNPTTYDCVSADLLAQMPEVELPKSDEELDEKEVWSLAGG